MKQTLDKCEPWHVPCAISIPLNQSPGVTRNPLISVAVFFLATHLDLAISGSSVRPTRRTRMGSEQHESFIGTLQKEVPVSCWNAVLGGNIFRVLSILHVSSSLFTHVSLTPVSQTSPDVVPSCYSQPFGLRRRGHGILALLVGLSPSARQRDNTTLGRLFQGRFVRFHDAVGCVSNSKQRLSLEWI
jgi:hypothetical protein